MDAENCWPVKLSLAEMYLLASLFQVSHLAGLEDPFPGWLADEIQVALEQARDHLVEQRFLEIQAGSSLKVDAGVAALIQVLSCAQVFLHASLTISGTEPKQRLVFLTEHIVEQEVQSGEQVVLTAVRNPEILQERLADFFKLASALDPNPAPGPAFTLSAASLETARSLARQQGQPACQACLEAAGVPFETAHLLAKALVGSAQFGWLNVLKRDNNGCFVAESMAWMTGETGTWKVLTTGQPGEEQLRCIPEAWREIEHLTATIFSRTLKQAYLA